MQQSSRKFQINYYRIIKVCFKLCSGKGFQGVLGLAWKNSSTESNIYQQHLSLNLLARLRHKSLVQPFNKKALKAKIRIVEKPNGEVVALRVKAYFLSKFQRICRCVYQLSILCYVWLIF
jgi:hypothetical protein